MRGLLLGLAVVGLAFGGAGCRCAPKSPQVQGRRGLEPVRSPPVPEPGAPRAPVTPDPASGGGTETPNGVVIGTPAREDGSNAGRVPPAKPGDQVGGEGLGFGNAESASPPSR